MLPSEHPAMMGVTAVNCPQCDVSFHPETSRANRAERIGAPLYCGRKCAGLARRLVNPPTNAERIEAKRRYDAKRRAEKHDEIVSKKRAYYRANRERICRSHAIYRKAHMHRHIAYCQRPEYRAWKSEYDQRHNARKSFGEFAEAFLLLQDIDREIAERASKYEIYMTNGTINKAQMRRRSL